MKSLIMLAATFGASNSLLAADSTGKDDVNNAAQKLAAADNYSWTTTTESPQTSPRSSHGKTEKEGYFMSISQCGTIQSRLSSKAARERLKQRTAGYS